MSIMSSGCLHLATHTLLMLIRLLLPCCFFLLAVGCSQDVPDAQRAPDIEANADPGFSILKQLPAEASQLNHKGELVSAKAWEDKNGQNVAVLSREKTGLFATHYTLVEGVFALLGQKEEVIPDCEFDLFLDFLPEAVSVTDMDNNGYGEFT